MGGVDPNNFENFRNQMKEETLSDKIRGYRRRSIIDVCEVKEFIRKIKELIEFYENNSDWKMPDKLKLEIYKLAGSSLIHSSQIPNSQRVGLQPEDTPGVRNPPRERQRGEASGTQSCGNCGHNEKCHDGDGVCYIEGLQPSCECKKFIPKTTDNKNYTNQLDEEIAMCMEYKDEMENDTDLTYRAMVMREVLRVLERIKSSHNKSSNKSK